MTRRRGLIKILAGTAAFAALAVLLFPLYAVIIASFETNSQLVGSSYNWYPPTPNLDNYRPVVETTVHFGFDKANLTTKAKDALDQLGLTDPTLASPAPFIYAATIRKRSRMRGKPIVDTWFFPLAVGQPLPSIPLWLDDTVHRNVDLEASYEETCRILRIA